MRAVVTGATSGIGEAVSRALAADGATVVMVGRSNERLARARERILGTVPGADLHPERADLSQLAEVRALAERLDRPDVVINSAAEIGTDTPEGLRRTLVTNHLAPYLLLRSLVAVVGAGPARFVVVGGSPTALRRVPVELDDLATSAGLGRVPSLRPFAFYGRTKNMNAMFTYALARRLSGTRITVNGVHPGIIRDTGLGRGSRGVQKALGAVLAPLCPGPDVGADTPVWLATSPQVDGVTGRFFVRRRRVDTAPHTTDVRRCDRLWDESARLVGLTPEL